MVPELNAAVTALGWKLNIMSPLNCGAFTMLTSLIICPLVSLFTGKKGEQEHAAEVLSCLTAENVD